MDQPRGRAVERVIRHGNLETDLLSSLAQTIQAVGLLGLQIRDMPGADRVHLKEIDAILTEAGNRIGMNLGDPQRPSSSWPEGDSVDNSHAPGVRGE